MSRRMLHSTLLLQLPILLALLLARETAASFTRRADNAVGQLELIAQGLREPSGPRQLLLLAKFSSSGAAHRDGPRWTCSDLRPRRRCVNWCGVRYRVSQILYCGKQVFPCREQNGVKTLQTGHLHICDLKLHASVRRHTRDKEHEPNPRSRVIYASLRCACGVALVRPADEGSSKWRNDRSHRWSEARDRIFTGSHSHVRRHHVEQS